MSLLALLHRVPTTHSVLCTAVIFGAISNAHAGDWLIIPHFQAGLEYTDNVTLAGQNSLQDYITSLNPGLSVRGKGARVESNIDYNMQKLIYDAEDSFSGLNHQLQGNVALTVVDQLLYFESRSTISQQTINNEATFIGRDNRSQTRNRTDVIYYELKPIVRYRFGKWANFEGSYASGDTSTSGGDVNARGSGDDEAIALNLSTGRFLSVMPLSVSYSKNEENFDSGNSNEQERLDFQISYRFDRKLRTDFKFGTEKNTGTSSSGREGRKSTWSIGGEWRPTARTEINGNYGKRAFGNAYNVRMSHRHRRWTIGFNYQEDITTRSQELRELQLVPLFDAFGLPVFDPNASANILNPDNLSSINENAFESNTLAINLDYAGRRNNFAFRFFETQRTNQGQTSDRTIRGWEISADRSLSRRLIAGMSVYFRESTTDSMDNSEQLLFSPFLNYTIGPHTDLNISYSYLDGGGPDVNDNFFENSISANITLRY